MLTEQHLATGEERGAPPGDTLLRRYLLHHAALGALFAVSGGGRALEADDLSMADLARPGGYFNGAVLLAPPADWDEVMARVETFTRGGTGQTLLWSAWPTPDLRGRGWRLSGDPPLLARPPAAITPLCSPAPSAVDVRPVRSAADLADWEQAAIDGYPLVELEGAAPGALAALSLLGDERLRFFVGRSAGRPVAAAASFTSHGIGSLAFGATVPAARRLGFGRRLAVERIAATPDLWMTGVFSDLSRRGAEALGFVPLLRLTLWILDRP